MMKKLMERFRMIRENQKKNGTKGFSMIELIIVIAVMAILIALIGTQLIPYLEKSRKTRDLDTLNAVLTAVQSTITDYEITVPTSGEISFDDTQTKTLENYLGYKVGSIKDKVSSKAAKKGSKLKIEGTTNSDGMPAIKVTMGDLYVCSDGTSGEQASAGGDGDDA